MQVPVMFTDQQVIALRQMIDIAVKAGGMRVAEAAVVLDHILEKAVIDAQNADAQQQEKSAQPPAGKNGAGESPALSPQA